MNGPDYATLVCRRLADAIRIPFREVSLGSWRPKPAECHDNVDVWVKSNPGATAVRGWVTCANFGLAIRLAAHSVVRDAEGNLIDITPLENERYRYGMQFVPHPGDEQEFNSMKGFLYIDCQNGDH